MILILQGDIVTQEKNTSKQFNTLKSTLVVTASEVSQP